MSVIISRSHNAEKYIGEYYGIKDVLVEEIKPKYQMRMIASLVHLFKEQEIMSLVFPC